MPAIPAALGARDGSWELLIAEQLAGVGDDRGVP
jgi:hypothetical protein